MYPSGYWPFRPPPSYGFRRRDRIRRIFYLRDGQQLDWHTLDFNYFGCRSVRYLHHIGAVVGEFPGDVWATRFAHRHANFIHWEPDIQIKIGEPHFGKIAEKAEDLPWGIERIEAHRTWPRTMGKGVRVAVIDTGIAQDHPALRRNYRGGVNILSPLFSPYDYNGHGTHVAGTIAARKNPTGVIGVAPRAHLYAVKAFDRKGSANLSDLLTAINWCIDNRMQVVNMSFGMNKMSETLKQAIQKARRRGIVMVAAAGNQGTKGQLDYPARYPETIAVTATKQDNRLASFSNTGHEVHLAAPGENITSTWLNGTTRELSGTSMAVPHVTGTVALLLSRQGRITSSDIEGILTGSSRPLEHLSEGPLGLVNAYASVKMLG